MTDAHPIGSYRSGFDNGAHATGIPPPTYPCPGLGLPPQQTAEQDRGHERNDRPPRFHGCGKCKWTKPRPR
jgi:hypothetical protein